MAGPKQKNPSAQDAVRLTKVAIEGMNSSMELFKKIRMPLGKWPASYLKYKEAVYSATSALTAFNKNDFKMAENEIEKAEMQIKDAKKALLADKKMLKEIDENLIS